jgi:DNA-binding IclR family transcriptional regulator
MSPIQRDTGRAERGPAADGPPEGGLDRAAAILGAFDAAHRELSLAALVTRTGLPRSTIHRTATRMIQLGWLEKPADRYRIGNRLFEIASLAPIRLELREAVLPFLQDLHQATKITVQLGVLDGTQVLVVEKITGHRAMPMLDQVGGMIPAYCSALGRAILAYSEQPVIDAALAGPLAARTPRTLTSRVAIVRELTAVPERGWAVDREEGNIGVSCVAAPIFGPWETSSRHCRSPGPVSWCGPTASAPRCGWRPPRPPARTPAAPGRCCPRAGRLLVPPGARPMNDQARRTCGPADWD